MLRLSLSLDVFGLDYCLTLTTVASGERRTPKEATAVGIYELYFVCPGYGEPYYRSHLLLVVRFCPRSDKQVSKLRATTL